MQTIARFPDFEILTPKHINTIQKFTRNHAPYSDFNFFSLLSYNIHDGFTISNLNDNLVVSMEDYITGESFLTFLGTNNIESTIITLLHYAEKESYANELKMIPEACITLITKNSPSFEIIEDLNSHDYLYDAHALAKLDGAQYFSKRRMIHRFHHHYPNSNIIPLNLNDPAVQASLIALFDAWQSAQDKTNDEVIIERTALKRLLKHIHLGENISGVGISIDGELAAFAISELVHDGHFITHFGKTSYKHVGIFDYLKHTVAKHMVMQGASIMNMEQDLGITGLRQSKLSWHPIGYLKKYTIKRR